MRRIFVGQPILRLTLLTLATIAIHGYHFGTDDGAVYLPAVWKYIHPQLYPYGAEFFMSHARLSQFAAVVGASAKIVSIGDQWIIFLWYLATTAAFLLAGWQLASLCFRSARARWSAVVLLAIVFTLPAAGTALPLMDPYLTARSASTPLSMFAVAAFLAERRGVAAIWLILAALVHPQMAFLSAAFLGVLALPPKWTAPLFPARISLESAAAGAFGFSPTSPVPDYRRSLDMRPFLFVTRWRWWEWVGVAAPLAFLFWCGNSTPRGAAAACNKVSRALVLYGLAATLVAVIISSIEKLEFLVRLQPMRAFQLIYIFFFLLLGGLLGEYLPKSRRWLWAAVFAGAAASMVLVQLKSFPHSRHIEWPNTAPQNPWVQAFEWVRVNTPSDAVFALDPGYINLPGEDRHGFRAIAERSVLSDEVKDSGVVTLFPQLASEWSQEQRAQQGWQYFRFPDFERLARQYPVTWVVLAGATIPGLDCPYRNQAVAVCRIPGAVGLRSLASLTP